MDPTQIQMNVRHNAEDLQSFLRDMNSWEQDMKKKDECLRQERQEAQAKVPPVRGQMRTERGKETLTASSKKSGRAEKKAPSKIRGSDYRAWDKFDVDRACDDVDEAEEMKTQADPLAADASEEGGETTSEDEDTELQRMRDMAIDQKDKGNAFFKQGQFASAIECYTRGMTADPSNSVLPANRAMALLKCERYSAALQDCEVALSLDPKYIKARLRRAACFVGLGHPDEAKKDYLEVLRLEPGNKQAKGDLKKLQQAGSNGSPATPKAQQPSRPRSNKPLFRMPIDEIGRPVAPIATAGSSSSSESVLAEVKEQPCAQPPSNMSVSEWLAKDERVIRTHDLLAGSVDSMTSQLSNKEISTPTEVSSTSPRPAIKSAPSHQTTEDKTVTTSGSTRHSSHQSSSSTTMQSQASSKPLAVPKTSLQLSNDLRKLSSQPDELYRYIKAIPPASYPGIFKQSLDSDLLSTMLKAVQSCFVNRNESMLAQMKALSTVRRFTTARMLLSSTDTKVIRDLLAFMASLPDVDSGKLEEVRLAYSD